MSAELPVSAVAILAGGLATRLRPITEKIPKLLVEVAGEPFFSHQIRLLRAAGLTHLVVCVGYLGEKIQEAYGDGRDYGVRIDYSFDGDRLLGTGGALRKALPLLGESFFVLYGDSYLPIDYRAVEQSFRASGREALMTVFKNEERWDSSNVFFEHGQVKIYNKKHKTPAMRHIDYGLSLFSKAAIERLPLDDVVDLADVMRDLVANGQLAGYEVFQRFYEVGSHSGLAELDEALRSGTLLNQ